MDSLGRITSFLPFWKPAIYKKVTPPQQIQKLTLIPVLQEGYLIKDLS